jgi:hypothetical protein
VKPRDRPGKYDEEREEQGRSFRSQAQSIQQPQKRDEDQQYQLTEDPVFEMIAADYDRVVENVRHDRQANQRFSRRNLGQVP